MKLIYCFACNDVVKLNYRKRYCKCKKSFGKYLKDGLYAEIGGTCIPIGFANSSFAEAIFNQPEIAPGERFEAFVIERNCPTVKVLNKPKTA